jgi:hypothetical protein
MRSTQLRAAKVVGEDWAERKADVLADSVPAIDWPTGSEGWESEWDGRMPVEIRALPYGERRRLVDAAEQAAGERWRELLRERLRYEDAADEEHDGEALALALVEAVEGDLPRRLVAGHDGSRAYLVDRWTGEEMTITSLKHAWQVVDNWSAPSH